MERLVQPCKRLELTTSSSILLLYKIVIQVLGLFVIKRTPLYFIHSFVLPILYMISILGSSGVKGGFFIFSQKLLMGYFRLVKGY